MPRPGLVVIEPELGLSGLERILDGPAPPLDGDQRRDRRTGRTPGREEGEFAVSEAAADEKTARPQPRAGVVVLAGIEIGELAIGPVVQPSSELDLLWEEAGLPSARKCDPCKRGDIFHTVSRKHLALLERIHPGC